MGKRKFKTESRRILDLMINSIYMNKEIFLRELISNASDAIDKYHYRSLTENLKQKDYYIKIAIDHKNRKLTITDNGIGMTETELHNNLGVIAKSGSKEFLDKLENSDNIDVIGQFGVGFYSSFMVADLVEVITKSPDSNSGYKWTSKGEDTYDIKEYDKKDIGTEIILHLRTDDDYDKYLQEYTVQNLITKYSDYIKYPIKMDITKVEKEETVIEEITVNSMTPLWKRERRRMKKDEINSFYKEQFNDFEDPFKMIHSRVEGKLTYESMLFIPNRVPMDLYSKSYEKGLQLYSKGVLIMDKCKDLVPEWMMFVRGVVDTADLDLNISRETLQKSRKIKEISVAVEKKFKNELAKMLKKDRDSYYEFWKLFGLNVKYGVYESYGMKKDLLKDLLIFSSLHNEYITLSEYVESMVKDQEFIYYATGNTLEQVKSIPQLDVVKEKGYEVLLLTDDIDEFMINILSEYEGKKFKSIMSSDLDLLSDDEKNELDTKTKTSKNLLSAIKKDLEGRVTDVRLSSRLKDSPVCIVSEGQVSIEMEKVIASMPGENKMKAEKILEINPNHEIFQALEEAYGNKKNVKEYSELMYAQAMLIEGMPLENPTAFSKTLSKIMVRSMK